MGGLNMWGVRKDFQEHTKSIPMTQDHRNMISPRKTQRKQDKPRKSLTSVIHQPLEFDPPPAAAPAGEVRHRLAARAGETCIHVFMHVCICVYIYIYIYISTALGKGVPSYSSSQ